MPACFFKFVGAAGLVTVYSGSGRKNSEISNIDADEGAAVRHDLRSDGGGQVVHHRASCRSDMPDFARPDLLIRLRLVLFRSCVGNMQADVNPVGKRAARGSDCYASRRQVASLDRRIFTATKQVGGASC